MVIGAALAGGALSLRCLDRRNATCADDEKANARSGRKFVLNEGWVRDGL